MKSQKVLARMVMASFVFAACVLSAASSWALPAVQQVTASPEQVELNQTSLVKITAKIANASEILVGAFGLERIDAQGKVQIIGVLNDLGILGDATKNDAIQTVIEPFREKQTGPINLRVAGIVFLKTAPKVPVRIASSVFTLNAGAALPTGGAATVPGQGGTVLTVKPGTFTAPMLVGISPVPLAQVTADKGNFSLVSAVNILAQPVGYTGSLGPAEVPLEISVPLPAGVTDTQFIIGEQVLIDSIDGTPGLKSKFFPRAMAAVVGGNIVTQPSPLKGIQQGGIHAVLGALGSAVVSGTVLDAGNTPVAGVVVSNNTNTTVDVTDANGNYSLFVSGGAGGVGPFTITAFHPLRGSSGSTAGTIVTHGVPINNVDITLLPLVSPIVTRDGIRNGGFEACARPNLDGHGNLLGTWSFTGAAQAVTQLGPTSTNVVILPTEGKCMVDFNTGPGAVANVGSALKQSFIVPAGATSLKVDFNFVSEEFPEFVGTQFNDSFRALITTPNGQTQFAGVEVNTATFTGIGDCGFPDGDDTCGQTGWLTGTVDLSPFAGTGQAITVELLFSADDRGDNIYDTHVLVDNIRFGTVWVDAKILDGANANLAGIEEDIRLATEILSQAGLNVRLRSVQTLGVNTPGYTAALLDTNLDYVDGGQACTNPAQRDGHRTQEEITLLGLLRSATATDINLYYSRSATRTDGALLSGYAIGPDEYCHEVTITTNSGLLLMDRRLLINNPGVLGHEIGHLLISPDAAGSSLEHGAGSTNFMNATGTLATAIVNRNQSSVLIRANAPLVLP